VSRRAERRAPLVGEGRARELTQKLCDALAVARQVPPDPRQDLATPRLHRLAVEHAGRPPQRLTELAERRPRARGISARHPVRDRLSPGAQRAHELAAHARLADAGLADDDHGPRTRLGDARLERLLQHAQLALPPHADAGPTEEDPRVLSQRLPLPAERELLALPLDDEALVEQPCGELVDPDRGLRRSGGAARSKVEQPRRALRDLSHGQACARDPTPHREDDRRVPHHPARRQGAARRQRGPIRRRAGAAERQHPRTVGEGGERGARVTVSSTVSRARSRRVRSSSPSSHSMTRYGAPALVVPSAT
jgi:hypothetical protein